MFISFILGMIVRKFFFSFRQETKNSQMKIKSLCESPTNKVLEQLQALRSSSISYGHLSMKKDVLTFGDGVGGGIISFKSSCVDLDENLDRPILNLSGDGEGGGDYCFSGEGRGDGYTERFSWRSTNPAGGFVYGDSCGSGSGDSSKFT